MIINKFSQQGIFCDLTVLVMGAMSALSFAPFDYSYVLVFGLAVTFASWFEVTVSRATIRGFLFGLGYYGIGVSWVYISVHEYGGADVISAALLTFVFVAFWSIFSALTAFCTAKMLVVNAIILKIMVFPIVWVVVECLRGMIILNGFPWLVISYSQLETPLSGYLPVIGSYGVSFILALTASVLFFLIKQCRKATVLMALFTLSLWCLGNYLNTIAWTHEIGEPFSLTIIQGNISQENKWLPENRDKTIRLYESLTKKHGDSKVIIWPETAVPAFFHTVKSSLFDPLEQWAVNNNVDLVIPIPDKVKSREYYNSVMTFGNTKGVYRKVHLLPFGEYLPFQPLSGYLLKSLNILPVGSFTAGDENQPLLSAGGYSFITTICYEDVFGNKGLDQIADAAYLVNVTNDAWFGDSIEPHQHMQIARMRAIETGRYLVRATNTGVSGFVNPAGKIISQAPMFKISTLTSEIIPRGGVTPYNRLGDKPILYTLLLLVSLIFSKMFFQKET